MGWRLVTGLAALAAVALVVTFAIVAVAPRPEEPGQLRPVDPALAAPWDACAHAVRQHLPERPLDLVGPVQTRWDQSGAGVDLTGRAEGKGIGAMAFGCHARRLDGDWEVDRLVFTEN